MSIFLLKLKLGRRIDCNLHICFRFIYKQHDHSSYGRAVAGTSGHSRVRDVFYEG